jgi:ABC-2 type transport system permease protein
MFLVAFRMYGLPRKADLAAAAVFLVPFITASALLGLAIGELFQRPESSTLALALVSVPALLLSGISFPWEDQVARVRAIALALPTTFGIRGSRSARWALPWRMRGDRGVRSGSRP